MGLLDGLDAILFFWLRSGTHPVRIFQSIAAGVLGREAFQRGWRTAVLGLALHFFIAFAVVLVYYVVSRAAGFLTRHPVAYGIAYSVVVYAVMNYIVIPLSAIGPRTAATPVPVLVNGLLIHAFGVGLPAALAARAAERRRRR